MAVWRPGAAVRGRPWPPLSPGAAVAVVALGIAIGALPPSIGGLLAIAIAIVLVGLVYPALPVYLLGFAAPLGSIRELRVGPVGVSATEPLIALALLSYALVLLARRETAPRFSIWMLPVALFVMYGAVSTGWAPDLPSATKELLRWIEVSAAFGLVVALIKTARQARILLAAVLLGGCLEGLLGVVQFVFRIGPAGFEIGRFLRAYGTFGQPNPYAGYLGMVLPVALMLALSAGRAWLAGFGRRERAAVWPPPIGSLAWPCLTAGAAALSAVGILMSLSRGAWLGAAVGIGAIMLAAGRRTMVTVLLTLFLLTLVALLGAFDVLPATALERIDSITRYFGVFDVRSVVLTAENWAIVERMAHWQAALGMWADHPLLGVGFGQYPVLYEDYMIPPWKDALGHAHNYYLHVAAEAGSIGLGLYLFMLGSWFALAARVGRGADGPLTRAIGLGVLGALAATATHNLFDNLYVAGMNVHIGVLVGLLAAVGPATGPASDAAMLD